MAMSPQASGAASGALQGGAAGASVGGPWGAIIGTGIGATSGYLDNASSGSVDFKGKYARNQLKHQRKIWQAEREQIGPNQAALMKSLDESGLHRLAALGISPQASSAPSQQPMIPGQFTNGSAAAEGINTAIRHSQQRGRNASGEIIAGLQVEHQTLQNDWLRTQIAQSELALLKEAANSNGMMRPAPQRIPNPGEADRYNYMSKYGKTYSAQGGTSAQQLEDDIGEFANIMPEVLGRAYDVFKAQLRNKFGFYDLPAAGRKQVENYPDLPRLKNNKPYTRPSWR